MVQGGNNAGGPGLLDISKRNGIVGAVPSPGLFKVYHKIDRSILKCIKKLMLSII
jgi:hypothetical protein